MSEDVLLTILCFALMPLLGAFGLWIRHRRWEMLRNFMRDSRAGGVEHGGLRAPDGRTLIELEKLRNADREKSRALFERLAQQKLDIVKTAITMGYREPELDSLDARLEKLIGAEKLSALLGELPGADLPPAVSQAAKAETIRESV